MTQRTTDRSPTRHLGYGSVHRRKTVDFVLEYLRTENREPDLRPDAELHGTRQRLRRQPWRQPLRPGVHEVSTLELIRRYEAKLKGH